MNIIIAGCGKVGHTLAEQLSNEGHQITVMDTNAEAVQTVSADCDVIGYIGDCTSFRAQYDAGIKETDLLIAATDMDEKNMLACLIARKTGHCQTIARVRSPQYSEEISFLKEELGLSMSVNPESAAAHEMVRLIQIPSALEVDTFAKGRVNLIRLVIPEGSVLDGLRLRDYYPNVKESALICVVERGKDIVIPDGNFVMQAGDKISVTLPLPSVNAFLNKVGIKAKKIRDVMIAGGGTISYYLADILIRSGLNVKIIEKEEERCRELSELLPKAMIINGDATDRSLLFEESVADMDAVCALMHSDEANILLSLFVSKKTDAKVMTRVHRKSYEDMVFEMPVGNIISTKKITAEYITRYIRSMQNTVGSAVETLYRMMDGRVEGLEFNVGSNSRLTGQTLKNLSIIPNTLICCIYRNRRVIIPGGNDTIEVGDSVIVVTTRKGLNDIDDILA
ncbi:trk system potassium uptake protein TrkA [Eubacterium ruminantium]|nr:trk system potassium uptake protein TrkA [Eubacterium ruminantium]